MGKGWIAVCFCCLALLFGLVAAGCGGGDDSSSTTSSSSVESTNADATEESAPSGTEDGESEVHEIKAVAKRSKPKILVPSGPPPTTLVVNDLEEGTGAAARSGDLVEINYVGVLYKSGTEFENTYDIGQPLYWQIGAGEVIKGWEQGMVGMRVGGRRELIIPPKLGFEPNQQPAVPPGETIVYVIDLIKAEAAPKAPKSPPKGSTPAKQGADGES